MVKSYLIFDNKYCYESNPSSLGDFISLLYHFTLFHETITSVSFEEKYIISNKDLNTIKTIFFNKKALRAFLENLELEETNYG